MRLNSTKVKLQYQNHNGFLDDIYYFTDTLKKTLELTDYRNILHLGLISSSLGTR